MTQLESLKAAFDRGESLTVAEALTRFGIYALSQRCGELNRSGYKVIGRMVKLPNGKSVKRYSKGLWQDGIHDDTQALQMWLDHGGLVSGS